ncbi:DNA polymerase III subunit delta [Spirochaeta lutea]|uniref:DNA-directed DNA polymerase n=1 Tax=Spirochaeta lutea TaxID=1480694 RepID=A0A098QWF4_9SPIO|nr:DNA polymerase III subunit delta [Spirochaeta lutea]KGE71871.1 hypothetical protein DC28_08595 [Spirochaeta lutea]
MNNMFPVYLFLGPESGEKGAAVNRLLEQYRSAAGGEIDTYTLYGFEDSLSRLVELARNGSLFSAGVFIRFRNAEQIKGTGDLSLLAEYLKKPAEQTLVVFESDETSSQKTASLKRIAAKTPKSAQKVFWEMFENQRQSWLINYIRSKGSTISTEAAELFLDLVQNNTEQMAHEADKLILLHGISSGDGQQIGEIVAEDIEQYIYHSKEENPFTIFKYVVERDFSLSLEGLQKVFAAGDSMGIGIMAGLLRQFRVLLGLKSDYPRGVPSQEGLKKHGVVFKRSQAIFAQGLRNFSLIELGRIVRLAGEYEFALREHRPAMHCHLLSLFCYQAVVRGGAGEVLYRKIPAGDRIFQPGA